MGKAILRVWELMKKGTSGEFKIHLDGGIKEFSDMRRLEISFYFCDCLPPFKNNFELILPINI